MHRCGAPVHGTDGLKYLPKDSFEKWHDAGGVVVSYGVADMELITRMRSAPQGAVADTGEVAHVGGGCSRYPQVVDVKSWVL